MKVYPKTIIGINEVNMKMYWNLTLIFLISSLIILNFLQFSTSVELRSPNLIEAVIIEDLKTIYELNELLTDLYNSGEQIENPESRVGGGYSVTINFLNHSDMYHLQHDRIIFNEYLNGEHTSLEFVKVNENKSELISRRLHYLWNQVNTKDG